MLTVKCSACSVALKLQKAPPSGKVKCPKCGAIIAVGAASQSASRPAAVGASKALDPDDDGFDFGSIQFPSVSGANAVSHFPAAGNVAVYEGPIPGDPLDLVQPESEPGQPNAGPGQAAGHGQPSGQGKAGKKKRSPLLLVGAIAGLLVLIVAGVGAAVMFSGGGGGPKVDLVAAAQSTAPSGYKAVGIEGCVILMPKGFDYKDLPSSSEVVAVESDESGSVYMMAAMNGGKRPLEQDQMIKKAERQLGGDILGGTDTERNGYKGYQGMLDGSVFLPRMKVEVFFIDERFVILGCAPRSMGADPSVQVNRQLEAEEEKIFYGSFKVGPKPSGWLW